MSRQFGASQRNPIAKALAEQDCLVLDGALATELERRGGPCAMRCGRPSC